MIQVVGRDVAGSGDEPVDCGLGEFEGALAEFMESDPEQQREKLVCNPILSQVAQERAQDMADRNYFGHTNPDGEGPNFLVRQAGYPLPDWYGTDRDGNNVESIAAGYRSADKVWQGWLNSSGHRVHVLGLHDFYAGQIVYGIGYYHNPDSDYGHYWVVLSAHEKNASAVTTMQAEPLPQEPSLP